MNVLRMFYRNVHWLISSNVRIECSAAIKGTLQKRSSISN